METPLILLVDDSYDLARGVRTSLMDEGYEVMIASDGLDGLKAARRHRPALIILDVNMPVMDGLELCRRLRQDSHFAQTPILFLTSRSSIDEKVDGLDQGADDYLTKPFSTKELKARIRSLLRRTNEPPETAAPDENRLKQGALTLDLNGCWVRVNGGQKVQLTPSEFDLLQYLMAHPQRPFSSEELLEAVWAYEPGTADPSVARWHIKNLRNKIEPDPHTPQYIRTIPRHGYLLDGNT